MLFSYRGASVNMIYMRVSPEEQLSSKPGSKLRTEPVVGRLFPAETLFSALCEQVTSMSRQWEAW